VSIWVVVVARELGTSLAAISDVELGVEGGGAASLIPGGILVNSTQVEASVNLDASYGLSSAGDGPPTSLPAV